MSTTELESLREQHRQIFGEDFVRTAIPPQDAGSAWQITRLVLTGAIIVGIILFILQMR